MSYSLSLCDLEPLMKAAGAAAWAVAEVAPVSDEADAAFHRWIADGCSASMDWLAGHADLRRDPSLLLPAARSIIIAAYPYRPSGPRPKPLLPISLYALGRDYHDVLRERLTPVTEAIARECGAECRICIDSAPLRERYWAVRAGLGYIGRNNLLIVPRIGSMNFLGCILTTAAIEPSPAKTTGGYPCLHCGAPCRRACPAKAIRPDSTVDARRCLSYLTIEHRGPLPDGCDLHGRVFGCDACALACPYNSLPLPPGHPIAEFAPLEQTMTLSAADLDTLSARAFARRFAGTPLARARLDSMRRNVAALFRQSPHPTPDQPCSTKTS